MSSAARTAVESTTENRPEAAGTVRLARPIVGLGRFFAGIELNSGEKWGRPLWPAHDAFLSKLISDRDLISHVWRTEGLNREVNEI